MESKNATIFEKTYAANADPLFRFVARRVADREQAIDILEDAFLRLWESLLKGEVREPRAFLYKAARNLVIDWYRKKKSVSLEDFGGEWTEDAAPFMDMFPSGRPGADITAEAGIILEKMAGLEPIYREAIYLRYVEELTPKEIAHMLDESPNLISVRINRGLKQLKTALGI